MNNFGVAITTLDRPEYFQITYDYVRGYTPLSKPLYIVDDGSKVPVKGAHYRNESPRGIAWAKNKCIELLMDAGVDHLFLFDDDCYPTEEDWWLPFLESGEHHLSYLFLPKWDTTASVIEDDGHKFALNTGTGCMLYYTRECIEKVGGMRTVFGRWSFEHLEHSWRIANAGLTKYPFMGLHTDAFYAWDEHGEIPPSMDRVERKKFRERNYDLFINLYRDKQPEFVDYRMGPRDNTR